MSIKLGKCLPYLKQKFTVFKKIPLLQQDKLQEHLKIHFKNHKDVIDDDFLLQNRQPFILKVDTLEDYLILDLIIRKMVKQFKSYILSYRQIICTSLLPNKHQNSLELQILLNQNQDTVQKLHYYKQKIVRGIQKFIELIERLELYNIQFDFKEIFIGQNGIYSLYKYAWQLDLLTAMTKIRTHYPQPKFSPQQLLYIKRAEPYIFIIEQLVYSHAKNILGEYSKQLYIIPQNWSLQLIKKYNIQQDIIKNYDNKSSKQLLCDILIQKHIPQLRNCSQSLKQYRLRMMIMLYLQLQNSFHYYIKYLKAVLLDKVSNFIPGDYETWMKLYDISLKMYARKQQIRQKQGFQIDQLLENQKQDQQFLQFLLTCDLDSISLSSMNFFFKNSVRNIKDQLRHRIMDKIKNILEKQSFQHSEDIFEYLENQASSQQKQTIIQMYNNLIRSLFIQKYQLTDNHEHHFKKMMEDLTYFIIKQSQLKYLHKFLCTELCQSILNSLFQKSTSSHFKKLVFIYLNTIMISCYEEQIDYQPIDQNDQTNETIRNHFGDILMRIIQQTVSDTLVYHEDTYAFLAQYVSSTYFNDQNEDINKNELMNIKMQQNSSQNILEQISKLLIVTGKQSDYKLQNFYIADRKQKISDIVLNLFRILTANQLQQRKQFDNFLKYPQIYDRNYISSYIHITSLKSRLIFDNLLNLATKLSPELPFIETAIYAIDFITVTTPQDLGDDIIETNQEFSILDNIASDNPIQCLKLLYKKLYDYETSDFYDDSNSNTYPLLIKYMGKKQNNDLINYLCQQKQLNMLDYENLSELKKFCIYIKLMTTVFGKLNERSQKGVKQIKIIYEKMGKTITQIWSKIYPKIIQSEIHYLSNRHHQYQKLLKDHEQYLNGYGKFDKNCICIEDTKEILLSNFAKTVQIPVVNSCIMNDNFMLISMKEFLSDIGKVAMNDLAQKYLQNISIPFVDLKRHTQDKQYIIINNYFMMFNAIQIICRKQNCDNIPSKYDANNWLTSILILAESLNSSLEKEEEDCPLQIVPKALSLNLKAQIIKILIPHMITYTLKLQKTQKTWDQTYQTMFKTYQYLCKIIQKIYPGQEEHFLSLLEIVENNEQNEIENSEQNTKTNRKFNIFLMKGIQTLFKLIFEGIRVRSYHLFKFIKRYCKYDEKGISLFNSVIGHYITNIFTDFVPDFQLPSIIKTSADDTLLQVQSKFPKINKLNVNSSIKITSTIQYYKNLTQFYNNRHPSQNFESHQSIHICENNKQKQNSHSPKFNAKTKRFLQDSTNKIKQQCNVYNNSHKQQEMDYGSKICTLSMFMNLFCRLNFKSLNDGITHIWNKNEQKMNYIQYLINITPILAEKMESIDKKDSKTLDIINVDCYGNLQIIMKKNDSKELTEKILQLCKVVVKFNQPSQQNQLYTLKNRVPNSLNHPITLLTKYIQQGNQNIINQVNKLKLSMGSCKEQQLSVRQFGDMMDIFIMSYHIKFNQGISSNLLLKNLCYLLEDANQSTKQRILQRNYRQLKTKNTKFSLSKYTSKQSHTDDKLSIKIDQSCQKVIEGLIKNFIKAYTNLYSYLQYSKQGEIQQHKLLFITLKMIAICVINHPQLLFYCFMAHPFSSKSISNKNFKCLSVYDILLDSSNKSVEIFSNLYSVFIKANIMHIKLNQQTNQVPYSLKLQQNIKNDILLKFRNCYSSINMQKQNQSVSNLIRCMDIIETQTEYMRTACYQIPKMYNQNYESAIRDQQQKWHLNLFRQLSTFMTKYNNKNGQGALLECAKLMSKILQNNMSETQCQIQKIKLEKNLLENNTQNWHQQTQQNRIKLYHPSLQILSFTELNFQLTQVSNKNRHQLQSNIHYEVLPEQSLNMLKQYNHLSNISCNKCNTMDIFLKLEIQFLGKCALKQMQDLDKIYDQIDLYQNHMAEVVIQSQECIQQNNDCIVENQDDSIKEADDGIKEDEQDEILQNDNFIIEAKQQFSFGQIPAHSDGIIQSQQQSYENLERNYLQLYQNQNGYLPSNTSLEYQNSIKIVRNQSQNDKKIQTILNDEIDKNLLMNLLQDSTINPQSLKQLLNQIPFSSNEELFKFLSYLQAQMQVCSGDVDPKYQQIVNRITNQLKKRDIKSINFRQNQHQIRSNDNKFKYNYDLHINHQDIYVQMKQSTSKIATNNLLNHLPYLSSELQTLIHQLHLLCYNLHTSSNILNKNIKTDIQQLQMQKIKSNQQLQVTKFITKYLTLNANNYLYVLSYYVRVMSGCFNNTKGQQQVVQDDYKKYIANNFVSRFVINKMGLVALFYGKWDSKNMKIYLQMPNNKQGESQDLYILSILLKQPQIVAQSSTGVSFVQSLHEYFKKVMNNELKFAKFDDKNNKIQKSYPFYSLQQQRCIDEEVLKDIIDSICLKMQQKSSMQINKQLLQYMLILSYLDENFFVQIYTAFINMISGKVSAAHKIQSIIFNKFRKNSQKNMKKYDKSVDEIQSNRQSQISSDQQDSTSSYKNSHQDFYKDEERYWSYRLKMIKNYKQTLNSQKLLTFCLKLFNILNNQIIPEIKHMKFVKYFHNENVIYVSQLKELEHTYQSIMKRNNQNLAKIKDKSIEFEAWKKSSLDWLFREHLLPIIQCNSQNFSPLLISFETYITEFTEYFKLPPKNNINKSDSVFDNQNQKQLERQDQSIIYNICAKFYEIVLASEILTNSSQEYTYHSMSKLKTLKSITSFASSNFTNISAKNITRGSHKLSISPINIGFSMYKPQKILKRIGQNCSFLYNYLSSCEKIRQIHTKYSSNTNKIRFLWQKNSQNSQEKIQKVIQCKRERILEDSLPEINEDFINAKSIKIKFQGEIGIDYGGVTRQWITLLMKKFTDPNFGLFQLSVNQLAVQPSQTSWIVPNHLAYFQKMGIVVGKAMKQNWLLQLNFTKSFLKHLLGNVLYVEDLQDIDPNTCKSLLWILKTQIEEDDLGINFTYEKFQFGRKVTQQLIQGGQSIFVNQQNKKQYIKLLANKKMTENIREQSKAFMKGLQRIIPYSKLSLFNHKQISLYLSGVPKIDVIQMKKSARYENYSQENDEIIWFWEILTSWSTDEQSCKYEHKLEDFLFFLTGSYKVPYGGFHQHPIGINKMVGCKDYLPVAHTCFSVIDLSIYSSKKKLQTLLYKAIKEGKGFSVS